MSGFELLDVIDDNDQVVGHASRQKCHASPPLAHRAVHFTLINPMGRQVLLGQRSQTTEEDAGKFCFVGVHVLAGEGYDETARQGLADELGVVGGQPFMVGETSFVTPTNHERIRFYLLAAPTDQALRLDLQEIVAVHWVTLEQAATMPIVDITRYWLEHVDWDQAFSRPAA